MDMTPANQPKFASTGGRRADRRKFDVTVQFRAGQRRATVKVLDISCFGARVAGVYLVHENDRLFITLPGIAPVEARVAWVTEFEFGCEFVQPLNQVILDSIVTRA
ncbi:MAG: PilZ domain-containing protein [Novosphingobium sp.]|jgi:hypothetical protein|nr:PilZ domain-containing protein [Brevundimonas sp.]MCZ8320186.1 PilZ domain-containing protein [Novosphingobium sp.]